jgi:phage shock protein A
MEDRVNEIEARAEAVSELYDEKTELDKEFDEFEKETGVDAELAELRKKLDK